MEKEQEYQEIMGSPEMEYLQYLIENPEINEEINEFPTLTQDNK